VTIGLASILVAAADVEAACPVAGRCFVAIGARRFAGPACGRQLQEL